MSDNAGDKENPLLNLKGVQKNKVDKVQENDMKTTLDHQKVLNYFQNLYLVAAADKKLTKEETSFLVEIAQQMGITPREAANIMMTRNERKFIIPDNEEERMIQLEDIIVMMIVDKQIHEKEYQLCLAFAKAIGKDRRALDKVILSTIKGH